jgi:serine/threonine protein kinase
MTTKQVGDYDIMQRLGRGSFADVYYAEHRLDGNRYAIKVISKEKIHDVKNPRLQENLETEILIMRDYKHDNIVGLFETFQSSRFIYLVMELCMGGDLSKFIKKRGKNANFELINLLEQSKYA